MTPQLLPFFSSQDPFENLSREELIFETFDPAQALLLLYINTASVVIGKNQNPWREARVGILEKDHRGGDGLARRGQFKFQSSLQSTSVL